MLQMPSVVMQLFNFVNNLSMSVVGGYLMLFIILELVLWAGT
jgi:hypothetical protein